MAVTVVSIGDIVFSVMGNSSQIESILGSGPSDGISGEIILVEGGQITETEPANAIDIETGLNPFSASDFNSDDDILLNGVDAVSASFNDNVFTLTAQDNESVSFEVSGPNLNSINDFEISKDESTGETLITAVPCFLRGTLIRGEVGDVPVEHLTIQHNLLTAAGELRRVVWVGHRQIDIRRHPEPKAVLPVRVRAAAFGDGLPQRDLWLSPGHKIAWEGALMPVSALLNGQSVAQVEADMVEYWHVELDAHDVLLAEGLPVESYLDCGNRTAFANGGAFIEAHPDFKPKYWAETCLPLVLEGRQVVNTKERLLARLQAKGWEIIEDDDVHMVVDGQRIEPTWLSGKRIVFTLPANGRAITLKSNVFVPAHVLPESQDNRELGLCVRRLQVDGDDLPLGRDAELPLGWHGAEEAGSVFLHRWTKGAMPLPRGTRLIVVDLAGRGHYWRTPENRIVAAIV